MRIGALTVKEYAWYHTMHGAAARCVTTTDQQRRQHYDTTVECYDVKDTTGDQIYKPQEVGPDGTVYKGNTPSTSVYQAMRETWHISLRKWTIKPRAATASFCRGYRSGKKMPCGSDATGFNLMKQASLRDCTRQESDLRRGNPRLLRPCLHRRHARLRQPR